MRGEVWTGLDRSSHDGEWPFHDLSEYAITENGFLPEKEPLDRFQDMSGFDAYDASVRDYLVTLDDFYDAVPALLDEDGFDHLRSTARRLPQAPGGLYDELDARGLRRLYQGHAFAASGYVHALGEETADHLPAQLAAPLYEATRRLDVPPILSYDGYSLYNWTLDDPRGGITLDNVDTVQNFMTMDDEDWFMLVHVEIENEAADAIHAIPLAQRAAANGATRGVGRALQTMEDATGEMVDTLARMPEGNSPDNYAHTFRHYIEAFDDVTYEGVAELDGPQSFRGETGAQSSIMPALDGAFGVPHRLHELTKHVDGMRPYMPAGHRAFIADVEDATDQGAGITATVERRGGASLQQRHDAVLRNMIAFRYLHVEYARMYIADEVDDQVGTGNTFYNRFLSEFIRETENQIIDDANREEAWTDYLEDTLSTDRWQELNTNLADAGKELGETTRPDSSIMEDMPFDPS
jgi:indoleamine 2,3-dioxygenase